MKKVLILSFLAGLSGCSTISSIVGEISTVRATAEFDATEYSKATHLRATIVLDAGKCSDSTFMKQASIDINSQALELALYSQGLNESSESTAMEEDLNQMTGELMKRYASVNTVSEVYCDVKFKILIRSIATIQAAIGGKSK